MPRTSSLCHVQTVVRLIIIELLLCCRTDLAHVVILEGKDHWGSPASRPFSRGHPESTSQTYLKPYQATRSIFLHHVVFSLYIGEYQTSFFNHHCSAMPSPSPSPPPWHAYLTIDLFAKVLSNSIFHPFIACLIPLCFRATNYPYESPEFIYTTGWAFFLVFLNLLSPINNRLAYGKPRNVDLEEEVIVITGGASGLGACLAEIYAMRGATVAVLDIQDESQRTTTTEGVNYYTCDVGLRPEVETAWKKIVEDVRALSRPITSP